VCVARHRGQEPLLLDRRRPSRPGASQGRQRGTSSRRPTRGPGRGEGRRQGREGPRRNRRCGGGQCRPLDAGPGVPSGPLGEVGSDQEPTGQRHRRPRRRPRLRPRRRPGPQHLPAPPRPRLRQRPLLRPLLRPLSPTSPRAPPRPAHRRPRRRPPARPGPRSVPPESPSPRPRVRLAPIRGARSRRPPVAVLLSVRDRAAPQGPADARPREDARRPAAPRAVLAAVVGSAAGPAEVLAAAVGSAAGRAAGHPLPGSEAAPAAVAVPPRAVRVVGVATWRSSSRRS